jgi:hypothetical protein
MTRYPNIVITVLVLFFMQGAVSGVDAQDGVSVVKRNDLAIGNISVGQMLHIFPQSSAASKFEVQCTDEIDILIQLVLPNRLREISGKSELGITFNLDDARWSQNDNVGTSTSFDPHTPLRVHALKNQPIIIWIGASVDPPTILQAGKYLASITLTATPVTR